MSAALDARMLFDRPDGSTATLFLGSVASVHAATASLRSAAGEAALCCGENMRVEFRNSSGEVVYASNVRGDGAACC